MQSGVETLRATWLARKARKKRPRSQVNHNLRRCSPFYTLEIDALADVDFRRFLATILRVLVLARGAASGTSEVVLLVEGVGLNDARVSASDIVVRNVGPVLADKERGSEPSWSSTDFVPSLDGGP